MKSIWLVIKQRRKYLLDNLSKDGFAAPLIFVNPNGIDFCYFDNMQLNIKLTPLDLEKIKRSERNIFDSKHTSQEDITEKADYQRRMKFMIENADIINAIVVDENQCYELSNGLISLNRDIVMKLIKIVLDVEKIKAVIGIGQRLYDWSKHWIFEWSRLCEMSIPHPSLQGLRKARVSGNRCEFGCLSSIIVDAPISDGVWKWTVQVGNIMNKNLEMGITPSRCVFSNSLYPRFFFLENLANYRKGMWGKKNHPVIPALIASNSFVSVEADIRGGTLSLFAGTAKIPCAFSGVPFRDFGSVVFQAAKSRGDVDLYGCENVSLTSVSLQRLCHPTQSSAGCQFYKFGT